MSPLSPLALLCIALAGGAGAVCRSELDRAIARARPRGPVGIFVVNVLASALMGLLTGLGLAGADAGGAGLLGPVLATGLLGGFSTFSTVAVDSAKLAGARRYGWLAWNTAGMLVVAAACCWATAALVTAVAR